MSIQEILTAGGGTMIVLLTLVQIAPIKLNPWSAIVKWIGHALNAEVLEKQQETQKQQFSAYTEKTVQTGILKIT